MPVTPVPRGSVATVVTSLQMLKRRAPRPFRPCPLRLVHWPAPATEKYRQLFERVGTPWLWFSRLIMSDAQLGAVIQDEGVEVYAVIDRTGIEVGMLELDFRTGGECELAFFGLITELTGQGNGQWLMDNALSLAWRKGIGRVWVHTCTLDHPRALGFYRKQGFSAFETMIEIFADPRIAGIIPRDSAPHIPLIEPDIRP